MSTYQVENLTLRQVAGTSTVQATWDAVDVEGVTVWYYVWARGEYAGSTTSMEWLVAADMGETVNVIVVASDEADFDYAAYSHQLPKQRPCMDWTRPLLDDMTADTGIDHFDLYLSQVWDRDDEPDGPDEYVWSHYMKIADSDKTRWSWTVMLPPLTDTQSCAVKLTAKDDVGNEAVLAVQVVDVYGYPDQVEILDFTYTPATHKAEFTIAAA